MKKTGIIRKGAGRPPNPYPRICSETDCSERHYAKGFCHAHYNKNFLETHLVMKGVAHTQVEAKKQHRTFYVAKDRCPECLTTAKWAHSNNCMQCFPSDGDRLGIDQPSISSGVKP